MIELILSYFSFLLYLVIFGLVIVFVVYFSLIGCIGVSGVVYSILLFFLVVFMILIFYENYYWYLSVIIGLLFILFGNLVMFFKLGMV